MSNLGRYTLHELIGAGGMAEVWLASMSGPAGFEKRLAIKKILPRFLDEPDKITMFIREAKLVAELVHPNIVQVFDFGNVGDEYFIAMEYVPGANLGALSFRARKQGVLVVAMVSCCAGSIWSHAHDENKPSSDTEMTNDITNAVARRANFSDLFIRDSLVR